MDDMLCSILMERIFTWNIQREVPRTGYPHPRSFSPGIASPEIWKFSMPGPSRNISRYYKRYTIYYNLHIYIYIYYNKKHELPSETEEAVSSSSGWGWYMLALTKFLSMFLSCTPILSIEPCGKEDTSLNKSNHRIIHLWSTLKCKARDFSK